MGTGSKAMKDFVWETRATDGPLMRAIAARPFVADNWPSKIRMALAKERIEPVCRSVRGDALQPDAPAAHPRTVPDFVVEPKLDGIPRSRAHR